MQKSRFNKSCYDATFLPCSPTPKPAQQPQGSQPSSKQQQPKVVPQPQGQQPPPGVAPENYIKPPHFFGCDLASATEEQLDKEWQILQQFPKDQEDRHLRQLADAYIARDKLDKAMSIISTLLPMGFVDDRKLLSKIAVAYLENHGDPEKALAIAKTMGDGFEDEAILKVAEFHCNKGELKKAVEVGEQAFLNKQKEKKFLTKVIAAYIQRGERANALQAICDFKTVYKKHLLNQVLQSYKKEGKLEEALNDIHAVRHLMEKEYYCCQLAEAYLEQKDRENALRALFPNGSLLLSPFYVENDRRDNLVIEIANSYYCENELVKALRSIEHVASKEEAKEKFVVKIATDYLKKRNDPAEALKIAKKLFYDNPKRNNLIVEIALFYRDKDLLEEALAAAKENHGDTVSKEKLIVIIAQAYLSKGDKDNALGAMVSLGSYSDNVGDPFLMRVALAYHFDNSEEDVVDVLSEIVYSPLVQKVLQKVSSLGRWDRCELYSFARDQVRIGYSRMRGLFDSRDTMAILKKLMEFISKDATVEAFLKQREANNRQYSYHPRRAPSPQDLDEYYKVLGLPPNASQAQIRKAYLAKARQHHPDKTGAADDDEVFKKIQTAYKALYHA